MLASFRSLAKELPEGVLYLLWMLLLIGAVGFHAGVAVGPEHSYLAFAAYLIVCLFVFRTSPLGYRLVLFIVPVAWILGAASIVGHFIDFSVDGTQYHQEALIQLKKGWNPFREIITPDIWDISWAVWLNSLPKTAWLWGSELSQTVGVFEGSKFLCLFLTPVLFLLGYSTSRDYFNGHPPLSTAIGLTLSLHPIAASQFLTNYMDGYVSLFALMSLTFLLRYLRKGQRRERNLFVLSLVLASLVKFTNLFFACAAVSTLLLTIPKRTARENVRIFATLGVGVLLGVVVCGFNPYLTNLIRYGSLNYPMSNHAWVRSGVVGKFNTLPRGIEDTIYSAHLPVGFDKKTRVETFFHSLFSKSEHASGSLGTGPHLKIPFTFDIAEWKYLSVSDGRMAGLGPLFSGIFLLVILGLLLSTRLRSDCAILGGTLLIAALANPYGWWGRYIGFFWGIIPVALLAIWESPRLHSRGKTLFTVFITSFAVANSLPIALLHAQRAKEFTGTTWEAINSQWKSDGFVRLDAYFGGRRETLFEHQIPFLGESYEDSFVEFQLKPLREVCFSTVYRYTEWKDPRYSMLPPMHEIERKYWIEGIATVNYPIEPSPLFASQGDFMLIREAPLSNQKKCAEAFLFHQKLGFSKAPIF